jgi:hypothetical protein
MELIEIQTLRIEDVRRAMRAAIAAGLDTEVLADFVALVDWSGFEDAASDVRTALGDLEQWLLDLESGDIDRFQFLVKLLEELPEDERASALMTLPGTEPIKFFGPFTEVDLVQRTEVPDSMTPPATPLQGARDVPHYQVVSV